MINHRRMTVRSPKIHILRNASFACARRPSHAVRHSRPRPRSYRTHLHPPPMLHEAQAACARPEIQAMGYTFRWTTSLVRHRKRRNRAGCATRRFGQCSAAPRTSHAASPSAATEHHQCCRAITPGDIFAAGPDRPLETLFWCTRASTSLTLARTRDGFPGSPDAFRDQELFRGLGVLTHSAPAENEAFQGHQFETRRYRINLFRLARNLYPIVRPTGCSCQQQRRGSERFCVQKTRGPSSHRWPMNPPERSRWMPSASLLPPQSPTISQVTRADVFRERRAVVSELLTKYKGYCPMCSFE